jgi:hypothetical protein
VGRRPSSGGEVPESLKALLARHGDLPASVIADARAAFSERIDRDDLAVCTHDRIVPGTRDASGESPPVRALTFSHDRVTVSVAVVPRDDGVLVRGTVDPGGPVGIDVITPQGALEVSRDASTFSTDAIDHGVLRVAVHLGHPPARIHTDWFAV